MIIYGLVSVFFITTIVTGAVINGPAKRVPAHESNNIEANHAATPIEIMTTVKPAQSPLITCFCNMPECLSPAGGDGTCSTRLGCFSEVRTAIPPMGEILRSTDFAGNETIYADNAPAVFPTIPKISNGGTTSNATEPSSVRGSYGCLDLLHYSKQPCDEILKSMESDASEFPVIQAPTNTAQPSNNALVLAFHCCQTPRCNGNQSGPAEGSVKSAQAVLVAALKSSLAMSNEPKSEIEQHSTAKVAVDPVTTKLSSADIAQMTRETFEEIGPALLVLGEPFPPSALKNEISQKIISAAPIVMQPILPAEAVPVQQDVIHNETVGNLGHVVAKRHDSQSVAPIMKQTTYDQENIGDFDDDIAAEVAAASATAKSLPMLDQQNFESSWTPRHGGVPDFVPPPTLQKDNDSYLPSYVNNNYVNDDSGINNWMIGITCAIVVASIVGLSLLIMSVFKIIRKSDIFRNYKSVCSNPGEPCACNGGMTRRRPRAQPDLDAAVAALRRSTTSTTAPLLPPPNPGRKNRGGGGHANAGASYNDSTGDTTYVFTTIPVPDNVLPLIPVVRR
ncbi:uncharacterized protein LOC112599533 [Melanaphis sacchari]|uniref:uncharacterized protein LOC112599533 n=1 Tax=Melanaphis sacchari TaxID=742174 RepID=UPI000DC147C2|nr:uncharacterized protein LOC112599533 [Melanaphis sacchari]